MGPAGMPVVGAGAVRDPPDVRVARAFAAAELGTGGPSGDRRTTVRGGSMLHDSGSRGGLAPLAGRGGGAASQEPIVAARPVAAAPGAQAVVPAPRPVAVPPRVEWTPVAGLPTDVDRRTAAPGGRPTVGSPGVAAPARLIVGTPFDQGDPLAAREPEVLTPPCAAPLAGPREVVEVPALADGRDEPARPVAAAPEPGREPAGPDVLGLVAGVVVVRRRTGADADRIEVVPLPAVRTVTGDIMRNVSPGPAYSDRTGAPGCAA